MKVFSAVHANTSISFAGTIIKFQGNTAEITEDLYKKIREVNYPHISAEEISLKTKEEKDFDKDLREVNKEYIEEIARLKNIIKSKDTQISELKKDNEDWKAQYQKDTEELKRKLSSVQSPAPEVAEEKNTEEDLQLKKELEGMKVSELEALAAEQGIPAEEIKKAKLKAELIELILKTA
jgi:hypothetical protein